ncbi:MAG: manganese efflux pump [Bacilli bacterium]|nr:manganese efflux pump [Bacilli bacterium]
MKNIELLLISIALSMDAFSVSICKGLTMKHKFRRNSLIIAISFSFFQMLMPLIGYFLGSNLSDYFISFNHIIAFILLSVIGFNMIKESYHDEKVNDGLSIKELFMLSIATSIDAMAVGITFSFFEVNLVIAILMIGISAFVFSLIGVNIGKLIGKNFEKKAQIIGGIVLILIGVKILLEHFDIF